jgi:hypothetical protein
MVAAPTGLGVDQGPDILVFEGRQRAGRGHRHVHGQKRRVAGPLRPELTARPDEIIKPLAFLTV